MKIKYFFILIPCIVMAFSSCTNKKANNNQEQEILQESKLMLLRGTQLSEESRYAIINRISTKMLSEGKFEDLVLYLTEYIERNPQDKYNAYWLLMCAYSYIQMHQEKVAEYYFERILRNYDDLMVKGKSIHFMCLEQLIHISTNHENRINYFNILSSRFSSEVNSTEMYIRLGLEYEQMGEFNRAIKLYSTFLAQPDANSIQIADLNDVYNHARSVINFNNSPKNWMYKTLEELSDAVKETITRYQPTRLDSIRSKVNFFAVAWNQNENALPTQVDFSIQNYMHGNRIRFTEELIPGQTINEAYLRTTGWTDNTTEWYFYFRRVNFPADPNVHGTWEWAGIYIGEMPS